MAQAEQPPSKSEKAPSPESRQVPKPHADDPDRYHPVYKDYAMI